MASWALMGSRPQYWYMSMASAIMKPKRYLDLLAVLVASSITFNISPRRTQALLSTLVLSHLLPTIDSRPLTWTVWLIFLADIRTMQHQIVRALWTQPSSSQVVVTQAMWCYHWVKTPIRFQSQSMPHISWILREKSQIYVIILTCSFICRYHQEQVETVPSRPGHHFADFV